MNLSLPISRNLLGGSALALAACAAAPLPPTDALQAADIAVSSAEAEHAADYAPVEMRSARDKLAAARDTHRDSDDLRVQQARRQADEARADAQLALAQAHLAKANQINQDLQKTSDSLREEIQRGSGAKP